MSATEREARSRVSNPAFFQRRPANSTPPAPFTRFVRDPGMSPAVRTPRQGGFTYVGLLIAVALMGVGLAAYGELYSHAAQREKEAELLFIGGQFTVLGGSPIRNLGLVDVNGVPVSTWLPDPDGAVKSLALSSKLFVGGLFSNIGGMPRLRAAQVDAGVEDTGSATNFAPDADGPVNAITISSPGLVLGLFGAFSFVNPGPQETSGVAYYGV